MSAMSFLTEPETTPEIQAFYDADRTDRGYVMALDRVWAYQPAAHDQLLALSRSVAATGGLSLRERGILVLACTAAIGDAYCCLAWGGHLAGQGEAATAAAVLSGTGDGLTPAERAMASWARRVATDPGGTTAADVDELRAAGLDDARIFAVTAFVALRVAFAMVNDALGAVPDVELRAEVPPELRDLVTWGR
jgi:uncharacterized peroxidase-related enzyme